MFLRSLYCCFWFWRGGGGVGFVFIYSALTYREIHDFAELCFNVSVVSEVRSALCFNRMVKHWRMSWKSLREWNLTEVTSHLTSWTLQKVGYVSFYWFLKGIYQEKSLLWKNCIVWQCGKERERERVCVCVCRHMWVCVGVVAFVLLLNLSVGCVCVLTISVLLMWLICVFSKPAFVCLML